MEHSFTRPEFWFKIQKEYPNIDQNTLTQLQNGSSGVKTDDEWVWTKGPMITYQSLKNYRKDPLSWLSNICKMMSKVTDPENNTNHAVLPWVEAARVIFSTLPDQAQRQHHKKLFEKKWPQFSIPVSVEQRGDSVVDVEDEKVEEVKGDESEDEKEEVQGDESDDEKEFDDSEIKEFIENADVENIVKNIYEVIDIIEALMLQPIDEHLEKLSQDKTKLREFNWHAFSKLYKLVMSIDETLDVFGIDYELENIGEPLAEAFFKDMDNNTLPENVFEHYKNIIKPVLETIAKETNNELDLKNMMDDIIELQPISGGQISVASDDSLMDDISRL